jgi:hypothetical protein
MGNIFKAAALVLAIGAILWALMDYFTLPVVAFNQAGQCVYIDTEHGRQNCDIIPVKHIQERVQ